jgi:hypothetical protein
VRHDCDNEDTGLATGDRRSSPSPTNVIDVWDWTTFDAALVGLLEAEADLMLGYYQADRRIFLEHDLGRGTGRSAIIRPDNPHAERFSRFKEKVITAEMAERTIRAWHYTRLTDPEVDALRRDGVHPSTPETLRHRLDAVVAAGALSPATANQLYAASPFHDSEQLRSRTNRFCMASHPVDVNDGGVKPLLKHWGGEVASMFVRDDAVLAPLATLGRPRIIELAVPVRLADCGYEAACAVVATFTRSRGGFPEKQEFGLRVMAPLPAAAVLAVHTEGEPAFEGMGRAYPIGFVDVSIGRWKEITEDEDIRP